MKRFLLPCMIVIALWLVPCWTYAQITITQEVSQSIANGQSIRTPAEQKIASSLLEVRRQLEIDGTLEKNASRRVQATAMQQPTSVKNDKQGRVYIYVHLLKGTSGQHVVETIAAIGGGVEERSDEYGLIVAWIPPARLTELADLSQIGFISPVYEPAHNTGAVTSQGDSRMRADASRTLVNTATGNGVKVGVISDDCGNAEGLFAARKANGELGAGATALNDGFAGTRTHEGLAMMEIVQDIAPQAQLFFATGIANQATFNASVVALRNAGCTVITDDLIFPDEPVFEDGIIAQAVNAAAAAGVLYTSSAGNQAQLSYRGTYTPVANQSIGGGAANNNVHDYTGGGSIGNGLAVGANSTVRVALQWDDAFGGSNNNYDLFIVNSTNTAIISSSTTVQNGAQDPVEVASVANGTAAPINFFIIIRRTSVAGVNPNSTARLKLTVFGNAAIGVNSAVSSTYGHSAAAGCVSSGAIDATVNNYNTIENFSNQGPVPIINVAAAPVAGARPVVENRVKPDVSSFDGVATSVVNAAPLPSFNPFFGTSAATPHVAGLAAQIKSANPLLNLAQVRNAIEAGSTDYGAVGKDNVFGSGRTDSYHSLMIAFLPRIFVASTPTAAIPDNNAGGVSDVINIAAAGAPLVNEVWLSVTVDGHNNYGDLIFTLTGPDGTVRTTMNRPVNATGNANDKNPNVILADLATTPIQTFDPGGQQEVVGLFQPNELISVPAGFKNRAVNGNWTLNVSDRAAGGNLAGLNLKKWSLAIAVPGDQTLPVHLTGFIASLDASGVSLDWKTASEVNNVGFILSRSEQENKGFKPIASYLSNPELAGHGTTSAPSQYSFLDRDQLQPGATYYYRLQNVDLSGVIDPVENVIPVMIPLDGTTQVQFSSMSLKQNFPNPFTAHTLIPFTVSESATATLVVYDTFGREVLRQQMSTGAGLNSFTIDAGGLPAGIYLYKLQVGTREQGKVMTVVR